MKIPSRILLIISTLTIVLMAQETTVKLPTTDNTSSFNVTKSNNDIILKATADGYIGIGKLIPSTALDVNGVVTATQFKGDGSQLTNVKSLANTIGGNQRHQVLSNYGSWDNVRQVTLTCPGSGTVIAIASGYCDWESKGWDLYLGGILMDQDPNTSWAAENEWYSYLNIITDYNCEDSSDQYTSFAQHRAFSVTAGTHNFYLWVNKYSSASITELGDVNISVMFFPTGYVATSSSNITNTLSTSETKSDKNHKPFLPGSIDGNTPFKADKLDKILQAVDSENRIKELETEVSELKKLVNELLSNQN